MARLMQWLGGTRRSTSCALLWRVRVSEQRREHRLEHFMRVMWVSRVLCVTAIVAGLACDRPDGGQPTTSTSGSGGGAAGSVRIVVIPKGTTHAFWNSVQAGARKASE